MSTTRNSIEDIWGAKHRTADSGPRDPTALVTVLLQASRALQDLKLEDVVA